MTHQDCVCQSTTSNGQVAEMGVSCVVLIARRDGSVRIFECHARAHESTVAPRAWRSLRRRRLAAEARRRARVRDGRARRRAPRRRGVARRVGGPPRARARRRHRDGLRRRQVNPRHPAHARGEWTNREPARAPIVSFRGVHATREVSKSLRSPRPKLDLSRFSPITIAHCDQNTNRGDVWTTQSETCNRFSPSKL